jgi:hypothetical protein
MDQLKRLKNCTLLAFILSIPVFGFTGGASAGDDISLAGMPLEISAMPALGTGEYGTDIDNENNARTGTADGDMDTYLYRSNSQSPIEFNINIPVANAATRSATLRMDVYDVDASSGEVDEVFVNGTYVGTLNGSDGQWGVNIFNIPIGVLKQGKNLVKVNIDKNNASWAVKVDWGIIKLASATGAQISKAWFTPVTVSRGNYINAFAEISDPGNKVAKVQVYYRTNYLFALTDPDGNSTWSGQFKIPSGWSAAYKQELRIVAKDANGNVLSKWPGIVVK